MFNLITADLYKLRKSLTLKLLLLITSICAVIMTLFAYFAQKENLDAAIAGIGFMFSDVNIMSIVGAVLASMFIGGDFDNKTIHSAISAGITRGSLIVSKAVVFAIGVACLLLPYIAAVAIALSTPHIYSLQSMSVGFLHILTEHSSVAFSTADIGKLLIIMLATMLVYIAQLSICIPLSFLIKKPVFVVALFYGFSILSAQLLSLKGKYPTFDSLFELTPFGGYHSFLTLASSATEIMGAFAVSIVFIAIMLLLSYSMFRKVEIK